MELVHTAIAHLEKELGHFAEAVSHEGAALRYTYSVLSPNDCAISHFNLANYLMKVQPDPRFALAHRLASTLIFYQMNAGHLLNNLCALRTHLDQVGPSHLPVDFDNLCNTVEQTEGVRFRELFARLPQRASSGEEALRAVLELAH